MHYTTTQSDCGVSYAVKNICHSVTPGTPNSVKSNMPIVALAQDILEMEQDIKKLYTVLIPHRLEQQGPNLKHIILKMLKEIHFK